MGTDLDMAAMDIETTGFDVGDEVTVVGFELELGCRVFLQTGGRQVRDDDVEDAVRERTGHHVVVSAHESERELLVAVREFAVDRLNGSDALLVGFNAETWQAGFDLPFLRSRYASRDVPWPFVDVPYADLMPVVSKRFNTTVDGDDKSDLAGVYAAVCDGELNDTDPFTESAEAVTAFTDGRFAVLVTHNVADVLRTGRIGAVTERYCSKSDYSLKSLTPTVHDR